MLVVGRLEEDIHAQSVVVLHERLVEAIPADQGPQAAEPRFDRHQLALGAAIEQAVLERLGHVHLGDAAQAEAPGREEV